MPVILKNEGVPIWKPSQTSCTHIQIKGTPAQLLMRVTVIFFFFNVVIVLCGLVNGYIGWEVSPTHAQGGPGGIVTA